VQKVDCVKSAKADRTLQVRSGAFLASLLFTPHSPFPTSSVLLTSIYTHLLSGFGSGSAFPD